MLDAATRSSRMPVSVRGGPGTDHTVVRALLRRKDDIDDGEYVSDAYLQTGSDGHVRLRCG
ncbi:hypothetical protein AB0D62_25750 [Streptomyces massasporeus]|uniref:hypothetical protein n=1 Tax=Streptomyces massasporeus TaxID=67324 RepID=UPI0033DC8194